MFLTIQVIQYRKYHGNIQVFQYTPKEDIWSSKMEGQAPNKIKGSAKTNR